MVEIALFALTLVGVGVFHRRTLLIALIGLTAMLAYKFAVVGFDGVAGVVGFGRHMGH